jgi:hypothetical protein
VVAAALVVCTGAASAGRSSDPAAELVELNAVRDRLGLAPLRVDPVALVVATRMARSDSEDRAPQVLDSQPGCSVCDTFFEHGNSIDPRMLYRRLGGPLPVAFGLWRDGWRIDENLSVFFPTAALVLDPRARTFASARTRRGMLVVAVTADPNASFRHPVRWPSGPVDPRRQLWAEVLLPPGQGYPHLYDVRDGRSVTAAYPLAVARGLARSRLVAFGLNTTLAYHRAYRVGGSTNALWLRTRSIPPDFLRRSWTFRSLGPADRAAFLSVVRRTPLLLRKLLVELDGAVEVIGRRRGCWIADACEKMVGDRVSIGFTRVTDPFVVLHELGHVVFDLALDERGRHLFLTAFLRAGWRDRCCINQSEVFADQLAFWALGRVPPGVDSYSDRVLLSSGPYAALLAANASYRPLPTVGLLKR